ncbi:MAG: uridine kinase [Lachnospiraceae bacterium]|nr:uridine kinase [Lachnospiraceae bacterium]MDD6810669.1 uridine kinase [Lachnospiraceae bacterium]
MLQKLRQLDFEKNYEKYLKTVIILTVLFKLLLMGFFSSDYQDLMFIPFVKCFLTGEGNPYQYYYDNQLLSSFPYPPVMLFVECIGGIFVTYLQNLPVFLQNILFKLPILLLDLLGLFYLMKISKSKRKYILVLYFLSPVILYASYMHGQLDIIPTVFLIGAIYYLTQSGIKNWEWKYGVFLTLALASKFHIVAVVPLFFLYLYKKKGRKKAVVLTGLPILATAAIVLPFWGSGFANMVLFNKEQSAIGNVFIDYGNARLLLSVLVLLFVYFQAFRINQINRDLLISMSGLLFSIFLAFVPAMPAWYIWVVPFFMLYLAGLRENRGKMVLVYGVFNLLYLLYYVCFHATQFVDLYFLRKSLSCLKIDNPDMKNIVFTLMLGIFLILVVSMYQYGVNSNSYYKRRNRPFTIGIAGDSGAGKSRLLQMLDELLSEERILNIEGDGDHKWERGNENWKDMTHLNPKANYLYRQAEDIRILRDGNAVKRADYDHATGTFTSKKKVAPKPYIVLCGLHSLYLPQMRRVLDMKIFLDTDENLRCYWKISRDQGDRGHDKASVMQQIEARRKDAEKYIYPQKQYADLVIRYFDKQLLTEEKQEDMSYQSEPGVEFLMDVSINAEPLLALLQEHGIYSKLVYDDDLLHQRVLIESENLQVSKEVWEAIALQAIPQIEDLAGSHILWEDGVNGAVQLMLLLVIGEIMRRD